MNATLTPTFLANPRNPSPSVKLQPLVARAQDTSLEETARAVSPQLRALGPVTRGIALGPVIGEIRGKKRSHSSVNTSLEGAARAIFTQLGALATVIGGTRVLKNISPSFRQRIGANPEFTLISQVLLIQGIIQTVPLVRKFIHG